MVPVVLIESGGFPVTNVSGASPFTPVDVVIGGFPVTLIDDGGFPVTLVNEDGSLWEEEPSEPSEYTPTYHLLGF